MKAILNLALCAAAVGCTPNNSGSSFATCRKLGPTPAAPLAGWNGSVFTIVMENKSKDQILGNPNAPFINVLARHGAVADGYHDSFVHPSEANYLWMVAGENFGILDDEDPNSHTLSSTSHLADQLEAAGLTWKAYQESMGAPCGLTSHGRYAAKHNPFVFFSDVNGWDGQAFHPADRCAKHVVDYTQLDLDIAKHAIPKYVFITPNLDNDMHDGSIAEGDAWLAREVPKLLATDVFKNGGALFLLWDEGGGMPAHDDPPFIVISPNTKGGVHSQTVYDTSSYLKTVEGILGVAPLPCGAERNVTAMSDLFTQPVGT